MIQKLKKSNAGFTLVELIVVIAILGVLAAVLVPQYIQYVDKSRVAVDEAAISEVVHAAEISSGIETVYDQVKAGSVTVTITDGVAVTSTSSALQTELQSVIGTINFKSKTYDGKKVTITLDANGKETGTRVVAAAA